MNGKRNKIGQFIKGAIPIAGFQKGHKGHWLGKKRINLHSVESKRKISKKMKGRKLSEKTKNKMRQNNAKFWLGKKLSEETKRKISEGNKGKKHSDTTRKKISGIKHWNWQGGITSRNSQIRNSLEYKLWQDGVSSKDRYYCQKCGENKVYKLVAHHILNFSKYPELRFAIDNGIIFCRDCHKEFHKLYGRKNNTKEQIGKFLSKDLIMLYSHILNNLIFIKEYIGTESMGFNETYMKSLDYLITESNRECECLLNLYEKKDEIAKKE